MREANEGRNHISVEELLGRGPHLRRSQADLRQPSAVHNDLGDGKGRRCAAKSTLGGRMTKHEWKMIGAVAVVITGFIVVVARLIEWFNSILANVVGR